MKIQFRPHHFLCAVGFEGKGYSDKFIKNFATIVAQLRSPNGDQTPIEITAQTDSICAPCPSRRGTLCATQEKITQLDNAHAKILDLKSNTVLTWGEAKQKISQNMTLDNFHQACAPCEWKALGVCEKALIKLHKTK